MKLLVETSGSFGLADLGQAEIDAREISHEVPTVVQVTAFVNQRMGIGQLKVLGKLQDEATQVEFKKYLAESKPDIALAVDSFVAAFGLEERPKADDATAKAAAEAAEVPAKFDADIAADAAAKAAADAAEAEKAKKTGGKAK